MKLNESNLADPLLLTGCALGGPPWGSVGPFGGQDLISTTTFPEEALLLPSGANTPSPLLCKNISLGANGNGNGNDGGQTGVELDALLIVQSSDNFAELKPLPPFEYTSAGPISLHNDPHLPQMSSTVNSPPQLQHSHLQHSSNNSSSNGSNSSHEKSPNSASSRSSHGSPNTASSPGSSLFDPVSSSTPVPVNISSLNIKSELADYLLNSDIDDIAALIGNAIADSTVPSLGIELDPNHVTSSTMDPWTELDAWIESACQQPAPLTQNGNVLNRLTVVDQDATIHTSGGGSGSNGNAPGNGNTNNNGEQSFMEDSTTSTLQSLLAADSFSLYHHNNSHHSHHLNHQNNSHPSQDILNKHSDFHPPPSILQSRLQQNPNGLRNGGNGSSISPCQQVPESTTSYVLKVDPYTLDRLDSGSPPFLEHVGNGEVQRPHTTHVSPPAVVTSSMMSSQHGGNGSARYRKSSYNRGNKTSPHSHDNSNLINSSSGGYHHPSGENYMSPFSNSPSNTPYDQIHNHGVSPNGRIGGSGMKNKRKSSKVISSSGSSTGCVDSGGLGSLDGCGKEKPIHRCGICNRGFLNKSNIKVHLRTHTGEKPFKCDTCGKAFRQKAHLLKHVQIHKRIPRD